MSDVRLIKKYPNRRLYDTTISSYITLQDVKSLVFSCTPFKVIDAKKGSDLTRCTLLQIISEQEENGAPILTVDFLQNVIRFYGDSMQAMTSRFLEHSMKLFNEQQGELRNPLNTFLGTNSGKLMHNLADKNMEQWQSSLEEGLPSEKLANQALSDDDYRHEIAQADGELAEN